MSEPRSPRWSFSYRASLILSLSLLVIATGLALSTLAFRSSAATTTTLAHSLFQEVSDHAVTKTRSFLLRAVPIAQALGNLADLGLATSDPERLARQLTAMLQANPGVSWISYSNEAGAFVGAYRTPVGQSRVNLSHIEGGKTILREHDVLADGSWRLFRSEDDSGYDPRQRPFYQRAKAAGKLVWPPPYIFYEQSVPGVTCANPLYDHTGKLAGVLTVDFDLNTLSQFVQQLRISPNSRLFIMSHDGVLLAHPTRAPQLRSGQRERGELMTVREIDDPLVETFDSQLTPEDRTTTSGADRARQFEFRHGDKDYFARATAFSVEGDLVWIVGAMAPQSDFLAAARKSTALSVAASLGALLVAVAVAMLLARRVSGPILRLMSFVQGVGRGDLSSHADLGGAREFRQLSGALNQMIDDLRDRMRLRGSMQVAKEVQQRLLPPDPPLVPGLDIHGFSVYCDETGGDYYDYILLQQNGCARVLVAIGDVMGHGIGSALVMASARAILHSRATACGHMGDLLMHMNDQLVPDMMGHHFITMLLWSIDPIDNTVCWASAGHDVATIYDPKTDEFQQTGRGGIPLGIDLGIVYEEHKHGAISPGQVVVLGTDGIWETVNENGEFYGRKRLRDSVRKAAGSSAADIAAAVRRDLDAFRGERHQEDDVTLVVIKVLNNSEPAR